MGFFKNQKMFSRFVKKAVFAFVGLMALGASSSVGFSQEGTQITLTKDQLNSLKASLLDIRVAAWTELATVDEDGTFTTSSQEGKESQIYLSAGLSHTIRETDNLLRKTEVALGKNLTLPQEEIVKYMIVIRPVLEHEYTWVTSGRGRTAFADPALAQVFANTTIMIGEKLENVSVTMGGSSGGFDHEVFNQVPISNLESIWCSNGLDEDRDGLVDCQDTDCCTSAICSASPTCTTTPPRR